jgi:DNA-binding NarL/FixJ family response regulator
VAVAIDHSASVAASPDGAAGTRTAVLLDPHPLWLEALERVLERIGVRVVGTASSPREALAELERVNADLLITEIGAAEGGVDGIAWLHRYVDHAPRTRVIVLSRHDEPDLVDSALQAGAVAYIVKTAHPEDLAAAIRQVFDHSVYLGRVGASQPVDAAAVEMVHGLTRRELEILQLLAEGHSNAQLARLLWVTEQTVKFHLSNIYRKLGVSNRTEASRWAQLRGLLRGPQAGELAAST